MSIFQQILSFYTHHRAILALLFLTAALEVLFVVRLLFPEALGFIIRNHVFEIVVLLAISQMVVLLFKIAESAPRKVCKDEHECEVALRDVVRSEPRAQSLHVLSSGLGSRIDLLTTIHRETQRPFSIEVLAQAPEHAPDRDDAQRMASNLKILQRDHSEVPLKLRLLEAPASIRALLVCDRKRSPLWGAASWYRYEKTPDAAIRVVGRRNPAIILRADGLSEETQILRFLMDVFEQEWAVAETPAPSREQNARA